jgi:hypothetical protein
MLVGLHKQACNQQNTCHENKEERVLESSQQSAEHGLTLVQLLKIEIREWDPEEAEACDKTIGNCTHQVR